MKLKIHQGKKAIWLAEQCKMGNVEAMKGMSTLFRSRCSKSLAGLLDQYEADPVEENEAAISRYIKEHFHEENTARAYMMWLVRAALYGDAETEQKLGKWKYYKENAFLPYDMLAGRDRSYKRVWSSTFLSDVGFIDVPVHHEDCCIRYDREQRYFELMYVRDYEPPDDDGFGAEWEYDSYYFDEYFCRLSVNNESGLPEAIEEMDRKRMQYWENCRQWGFRRKKRRAIDEEK